MKLQEKYLNVIIASCVTEETSTLISYLTNDEKLAAVAIAKGININIGDFPVIADNERASNIKVVAYNPLTDSAEISFVSLKQLKWVNELRTYVWTDREKSIIRNSTITFDEYHKQAEEWTMD